MKGKIMKKNKVKFTERKQFGMVDWWVLEDALKIIKTIRKQRCEIYQLDDALDRELHWVEKELDFLLTPEFTRKKSKVIEEFVEREMAHLENKKIEG